MNFLAILILLVVGAPQPPTSKPIRISLFSLFKPETLQLRIAAGEAATLDGAGLVNSVSIAGGDVIRIRLAGNRLDIVETNPSFGSKRLGSSTEARVIPAGRATIELILPGRIRRELRGTVLIDAGAEGRGPLRILLETGREAAVASIVAAETNRREPEALKALAVVVRTFMLSHLGRHSSEGFDFCDTTHCQLYRGEQDLSDKTNSLAVGSAISQTAGQVIRFNGRLVETFYTAACGGETATPMMVWGGGINEYPYRRIECRWCRDSRFDKWQRSASAIEILGSLSTVISTRLSSSTELIADAERPSGFVRSITVLDGSRRVVLSTDAFRRAIGTRLGWNTVLSPTFTIDRRGSRFIFKGRGFGSQVGLCEEGAIAQAVARRSYRDILTYYFPGTEVSEQSQNE